MRLCALLITLWLIESSAQELSVYSDLIVLAEKDGGDLGCEPVPDARALEVLSPLLPIGGRMSLVVVVRATAGSRFVFDIGMNPQDRIIARAYRYFPGLKFATSFYAQPMEEVRYPFQGRVAEGQRCAIFFLDLTTQPNIPPERVKVEPSAWVPKPGQEEFWNRYPLEVRLVQSGPRSAAVLEECESPLRAVAAAALEGCPLRCRPTVELTLGSFLTRQYHADFPPREASPSCTQSGGERDLLNRFSRARAKPPLLN